jgi:rod shape-determining protein MreC
MALVAIIILVAIVLSVAAALSPGVAVGGTGWIGDFLKPIQTVTVSVSDWVSSFWTNARRVEELEAENATLRRYIAETDEPARLYEQAVSDNERLRDLLDFSQRKRDLTYQPAAVIARDTDNYAKTFTISRGSRNGIEPNMLVINEIGQLVGVVSFVSAEWATVRSIVDSDFAIGAYAFRARIDGVCRGKFEMMNENTLTMIGLTPDADIKVGDEILTSGVGGQFPRDIVIGEVVAMEFDPNGMTATAIIAPAAELKRIEQMFVITSFESED